MCSGRAYRDPRAISGTRAQGRYRQTSDIAIDATTMGWAVRVPLWNPAVFSAHEPSADTPCDANGYLGKVPLSKGLAKANGVLLLPADSQRDCSRRCGSTLRRGYAGLTKIRCTIIRASFNAAHACTHMCTLEILTFCVATLFPILTRHDAARARTHRRRGSHDLHRVHRGGHPRKSHRQLV